MAKAKATDKGIPDCNKAPKFARRIATVSLRG